MNSLKTVAVIAAAGLLAGIAAIAVLARANRNGEKERRGWKKVFFPSIAVLAVIVLAVFYFTNKPSDTLVLFHVSEPQLEPWAPSPSVSPKSDYENSDHVFTAVFQGFQEEKTLCREESGEPFSVAKLQTVQVLKGEVPEETELCVRGGTVSLEQYLSCRYAGFQDAWTEARQTYADDPKLKKVQKVTGKNDFADALDVGAQYLFYCDDCNDANLSGGDGYLCPTVLRICDDVSENGVISFAEGSGPMTLDEFAAWMAE